MSPLPVPIKLTGSNSPAAGNSLVFLCLRHGNTISNGYTNVFDLTENPE